MFSPNDIIILCRKEKANSCYKNGKKMNSKATKEMVKRKERDYQKINWIKIKEINLLKDKKYSIYVKNILQ